MTDALFPRPSFGRPAFAPGGTAGVGIPGGVRELLRLINDALRGSDTAPDVLITCHTTTQETPPRANRLGRGRASRGLPAESHATPPPHQQEPQGESPDAGDTSDTDEIDEIHAETWHLVRLAQAGDGDAFGMLYDRYVDSIFRFIYFRVNDRSLAEDFTSETFLRALRRIGTISYQGRDIGAWFMTIARNIVLDHVKSARHRLETPTADTIEGKEHHPSTETAVLQALQSEQLMRAVGELGDEQRECVMLRFIQGLSVNETAQIMGKNDGAIKALQHRAVRKLATIIGPDLR